MVKSRYMGLCTSFDGRVGSSGMFDLGCWREVWRLGMVPKIRIFEWMMVGGDLPSRTNLRWCRLVVDTRHRAI